MTLKPKIPQVKDVAHKTVLVRVDFNVPLGTYDKKITVTEDRRIQATLKLIQFLIDHQAKVILMSHLGRPEGKPDPEFSLQPVATHLAVLLKQPVLFAEKTVGSTVTALIDQMVPGQVLLLENLRFQPEEEANDKQFARQLASLAEVYINEAFSAAHRAHASTEGVTHFLPSFMGFAFAKEVATLHNLMTNPRRPFVMVVGGAKISDKVQAVTNLTSVADIVLVGGGVANNFLKAEGYDIAKSYVQDKPVDQQKKGVDYVEVAEELIDSTKQERILKDNYIPLPKILYPIDVIAATSPAATTSSIVELTSENHQEALKKNLMYLDIGPKTIRLFEDLIASAGTVFWNGPMGVFENPTFAQGTRDIAKAIARSSATSILGGGDTVAAVEAFKLQDRYDYISTAGSAALEFLSGKTLPGVAPLLEKE